MSEEQNNQKNDWKKRELGALWRREGKNQNFLSGMIKIEDEFGMQKETKIVVFTNKGKIKNEKAPDFIMYEDRPREEKSAEDTPSPTPPTTPPSDDGDEVPVGF